MYYWCFVSDEVRTIPELLTKAIAGKHFLFAVRNIERYEEMMQRPELINIKALVNIREDIGNKKKSLPDILIDELNTKCYTTSTHILASSFDKMDASKLTDTDTTENDATDLLDSQPSNDKNLNAKIRRATIKIKTPVGLSPSTTMPKVEELEDDMNSNPEADTAHYVKLVIESLDKLKQLPNAQSRLIQGLRFELRSLIDSHIKEFGKSYVVT